MGGGGYGVALWPFFLLPRCMAARRFVRGISHNPLLNFIKDKTISIPTTVKKRGTARSTLTLFPFTSLQLFILLPKRCSQCKYTHEQNAEKMTLHVDCAVNPHPVLMRHDKMESIMEKHRSLTYLDRRGSCDYAVLSKPFISFLRSCHFFRSMW